MTRWLLSARELQLLRTSRPSGAAGSDSQGAANHAFGIISGLAPSQRRVLVDLWCGCPIGDPAKAAIAAVDWPLYASRSGYGGCDGCPRRSVGDTGAGGPSSYRPAASSAAKDPSPRPRLPCDCSTGQDRIDEKTEPCCLLIRGCRLRDDVYDHSDLLSALPPLRSVVGPPFICIHNAAIQGHDAAGVSRRPIRYSHLSM